MTVFSIVKFFLGRGDEFNLKGLSPDLRKRVRRLRQEGDLVGAAEVLFEHEHYDSAAALFAEAKMPSRAAEAQELAGNAAQAIALYKTVGNRKRAGELYAEMGQYEAAAQQMLQTGEQKRAAEYFSLGGQHRRAGELFEENGEFLKAAKCYQDAADTGRQMTMLARAFDAEYQLANGNLKLIESARLYAKQAGRYLASEGHHDAAVKLLDKAGFPEESGKVLAKARRFLEAGKRFEEAGAYEYAARVYQDAGRPHQAAAARAQVALAAGKLDAAAKMLAKAGEFESAADILVDLNEHRKAAQLFARGGKYLRAAELFERVDDLKSAAEAYESAQDHARAADIYAKLGNANGEIRAAKNMEDFYRVGRILVTLDRLKEAVDALDRVDPTDPRYKEALELRGDILWKTRDHQHAFRAYRDAFGDANPNASNIQLLYKMGRCMENSGDADAAAQAFGQVISVDSSYRDAGARLERMANSSVGERPRSGSGSVPAVSSSGSFKPIKGASAVLKRKRPSGARLSPARPSTGPKSAPASRPQTGVHHPFELAQNSSAGTRRYEIIEEIARGGMGIVFRAEDVVLSRTVAFKILSKQLRDNEQAREYFLREARAAAKLQHPNIVSVYDAGIQDGEYFMAMEYIDGRTLKQVVTRNGPFPEKLVRYIAQLACKGLQYAHERGIVHRDIKSGNIMLTNAEKQLKIMDFGLAKVVTEVHADHTRAIGTPFYMSPEQILGDDLDQRSDIYSLGVTLFEISTGTVPFFKGDLAYNHVHKEPPAPRSLNPGISTRLEAIILKSMAKKPEERFETCNHLLEALKRG